MLRCALMARPKRKHPAQGRGALEPCPVSERPLRGPEPQGQPEIVWPAFIEASERGSNTANVLNAERLQPVPVRPIEVVAVFAIMPAGVRAEPFPMPVVGLLVIVPQLM